MACNLNGRREEIASQRRWYSHWQYGERRSFVEAATPVAYMTTQKAEDDGTNISNEAISKEPVSESGHLNVECFNGVDFFP